MSEPNPDLGTGDRWLKWCREAQSGDQQAEAWLLEEVRVFFRALARKETWDLAVGGVEASDMAQDCCLKLTTSIHQFRGVTGVEFIAWLRTLARNANLDVRRRDNAQIRGGGRRPIALPTDANGDVAIAADVSTPSKETTRQEEYELYQKALALLPADHQQVIRLRLSPDKLSWAEIAERMGRGEDAAKQLFQRAYKELKRINDQFRGDS